jgi:hypothetical protein
MADWYVYSGAAGTGTGANWANAKTTLPAAATAAADGDTAYVAHDHAETGASNMTIAPVGVLKCYCVNRAGSVPPVAADLRTTATVTVTGAPSATPMTITTASLLYCYGISFASGSGASSASMSINGTGTFVLEAGNLRIPGTNTADRINLAATNTTLILINSNCRVGIATAGFSISGRLIWRGGAFDSGTVPTSNIFRAGGGVARCIGCDFSNLGAATPSANTLTADVRLTGCLLGASFAVTTPNNPTGVTVIEGCNVTASGIRRDEKYLYSGTLTTETTIVRTAGASDGATAFSHKIVTNSLASRVGPFESFDGVIYNTATGSAKTLTVHLVTDNIALQDADCWLEIEYLDTSGSPKLAFSNSAPATPLTAGANLASDSGEAWTTTGLTTPLKQKVSVTVTPQVAGPIRWRLKVAKASTTLYACPRADLT